MNDLFVQSIGVVGILFIILSYQFNKRSKILYLQMGSALVWTLHFLLLGALTGAMMNLSVALRNFVFVKYRHQQWVFWVMMIVIILLVIITYKNWTSLLPATAAVLTTLAAWQKSPHIIRWVALTGPPLWFIYNYFNGSYPGMIADTVGFCSILAGVVRFDILPKIKRMTLRPQVAEAAVEKQG